MHRLRKFTSLLFLHWVLVLACISQSLAQAPRVNVSVSPQEGTTNETFFLQVSVQTDQSSGILAPRFESSEFFSLGAQGTSTRRQIINGEQSFQVSFNYQIAPKRSLAPNSYPLPRGLITVDGRDLAINPPKLKITASEEKVQDQKTQLGVDFVQIVDTTEPFVGQQVGYRVEVAATTELIRGQLDDYEAQGFWRERFGSKEKTARQAGSLTINSFSEALFPTRAGPLTIPERVLIAELRDRRAGRPRRSIFDDSLLDNMWPLLGSANTVTKRLLAEPVQLEAKPLPPPPANAQSYIPVGKVKISSSIDRDSILQSDSVTLTIQLFGDANLRPFELENRSGKLGDFKRYDEKPILKAIVEDNKVKFFKTFKLALVPLKSGELRLPRFEIVVFDPETEEYQHLKTIDAVIRVEAVEGEQLSSREEPLITPQPTEGLKAESEGDAEAINSLPLRSGTALYDKPNSISWLQVLCALAFVSLIGAGVLFQRARIRRREFSEKHSLPLADVIALRIGELDFNSESRFAEGLRDALLAYITERTATQKRSPTAKEAQDLLTQADISAELTNHVFELLHSLELSIYSSNFSSLRPAYKVEAAKLVATLESEFSSKRGSDTSKVLNSILLFAFTLIGSAALVEQASATDFIRDAERAFRKGDFVTAAEAYEAAIQQGYGSGALYLNLGMAYAESEKLGLALFALRKAKLLLPKDEEVDTRLTLLREQISSATGYSAVETSSSRYLPHTYLTDAQVKLLVILLYICVWVSILSTRRVNPLRRRVVQSALVLSWIFVALTAVFGRYDRLGRPILDWSIEAQKRVPALLSSGTAEVYSAPREDSQIVFVLHEGAEVELEQGAEEWNKVFLPDARFGWVKNNAVQAVIP